jgi:hypothetical protein
MEHLNRAEPAKFRALYEILNKTLFHVPIFFYNNHFVTIFQN